MNFARQTAVIKGGKNMNEYKSIISAIVRHEGGYREREIWKRPHTIEKSETWNKVHKVVNVLALEPEEDGYFPGFAVDLVTRSICG